jgi:hypothetical protein
MRGFISVVRLIQGEPAAADVARASWSPGDAGGVTI